MSLAWPLYWLSLLLIIVCGWARREEVAEVYETPLLDLVYRAATVHRMYNDPQMVLVPCYNLVQM